MIVVTIPPLPGKGGEVYDGLLGTFRTVLGPEKFAQFNAMAGTSFDSGFDSFGASNMKYELTAKDDGQGHQIYEIKKSYSSLEGSGWSGSTAPAEYLSEWFPVLATFVPAGFKKGYHAP